MRLYKRGHTWYADLREHGMGRVSTGCKVRGAALQAAMALINSGHEAKDNHILVEHAIERAYDQHYRSMKGSLKHLSVLSKLKDHLGRIPVQNLDSKTCLEYRDRLREGTKLTPATINKRLGYLSKVLQLCCLWGYLDKVPMIPRLPTGNTDRHYVFSMKEIHDILINTRDALNEPAIWQLIYFLYLTGCRMSEALNLRGEDVDIRAKELTFRDTKNGKDRTIPISDTTVEVLRGGLRWKGVPVHRVHMIWDRVRRMMDQKDNKGWVIHSLRHTRATRMLDEGTPIEKVSAYLGHSSIKVTERYAKVSHLDGLKGLD